MMPRPSWRHALRSVIALVLIISAMMLLRWRLFAQPGLLLGWNSDTAIYGLIAEQMVEERRPIFLFWGQDYLGTLTSMWAIGAALIAGGVGPLALRIGAVLQVAVALLLFSHLIHRAWGIVPASITVAWLVAGPRWFFEMTYAPLSAEQMFFAGALVLWYADRRFATGRQWLMLGVLAGIGWWAHRGSMFAAVPAAAMIVAYDEQWRTWRGAATACAFGALGVMIGSVPLLLGRNEIDQRLYEPITAQWSLFRLPARVSEVLRVDLWAFVGADAGSARMLFGVLILTLAILGFFRSRTNRTATMLLGVLAVVAVFWIFSPQAYSGATRYLMLALPVVYGLAARGLVVLLRRRGLAAVGAVLAGIIITAHLYATRLGDTRDIAAGRREDHYVWKSFDPRPALARLRRENYAVCYADFWVAYKLEWLSESQVKFIPYRSVDRTQRRSRQLAVQPGRKCFVSSIGTIQTLSDGDEATYRATVLSRRRPPQVR